MIIQNKLQQMIILNLTEGRNVHLPAGKILEIQKKDLESPQLQNLIDQGIIVVREEVRKAPAGVKPEITQVSSKTTEKPETASKPIAPVETAEKKPVAGQKNADSVGNNASAKTNKGTKTINSKGDSNA